MQSDNQKRSREIARLIALYIKGEISLDKEKELLKWKNASESNKKAFEACTSSTFFEEAFLESNTDQEHHEMIWKHIKKKTISKNKKQKFYIVLRAAAAILILIGIATLFFQIQQYKLSETRAMNLKPGTSRAILELADGERLILAKDSVFSYTSNFGTEIENRENSLNYQASAVTKEVYNRLHTPRGGEYKLVLSDGTRIYLNAESELYYPEAFLGKQRKVYLKGEAYFEVKHNKKVPFIIDVNGMETEVLGTTFNIRHYPEDKNIVTTLVTGKIIVKNKNKTAILNPGQQALMDTDLKNIEIKHVDTKYFTAWHDGRLIYDNEPLDKILTDLSRWYNFDLFYMNQDAKTIPFSCNIERYEDLGTVFTLLEKTHKVKFEVNKNNVVVQSLN